MEVVMASQANDRQMISERIAPGMLPRVLTSFDMTIIFVAIVLLIVNASAIQQARRAAYTYWSLGFLAFLIPGALVTAQLGQMFPQEGSLYVWTQKALGPFWGFRSEEHTSELQSQSNLVCRLLLEKKKNRRLIRNDACDLLNNVVVLTHI